MKNRSERVLASIAECADEQRRRAGIIEDYLFSELAREAFASLPDPAAVFSASTRRDEEAVAALRAAASPHSAPGVKGARFAALYAGLCRRARLLPELYDTLPHVEEPAPPTVLTAAYVTGGFADAAFAAFRDELSRAFRVMLRPHHSERVSGACDCVLDGEADYAVIPVRSSRDGVLRPFYHMIDSHDLKLLAAASVGGAGGEGRTCFALCGADAGPLFPVPELFEFTVAGEGVIPDVAAALVAHGHAPLSVVSYPSEDGGLRHHFTSRVGGDLRPTLLYLNLYHSYTVLGIYRDIDI